MEIRLRHIALILAALFTGNSCHRDKGRGGENPSSRQRPPGVHQSPLRNDRLGRNVRNAAAPAVSLNSSFDQGRHLVIEAGGTVDDYLQLKLLIEERLAALSTDNDRASLIMGVMSALSADFYLTKWKLAEDFINQGGARTEALVSAIRDAAKCNPPWAFEKLRSYEDPVVCENAIQGVVKTLLAEGSPLEVAKAIKAELGDSEVYSLALKHWLDSVKDIHNLSGAKGLVNELIVDSRVNLGEKEKLANLYVQIAGGDPPLAVARLLSQQGIRDGGWGQLVGDGAKLTGAEGNEFIGLVFNASPYKIEDFMKQYRKTHDAKTIYQEFDSFPRAAQAKMLCAAAPYAIANDAIPELLAKVDGLDVDDRNRVIERLVDYGGQNHIPKERLQQLFDYGGGDTKRDKIYNHYFPRE